MIVDCHTHLNYDSEDAGISEHLAAAEPVTASVVLDCTNGDKNEKTDAALSDYVKKHDKIIGFAAIDPRVDPINSSSLKQMVEEKQFSGAVLYCANQGFHPAHTDAMRFYEYAEELHLPVFFHGGYTRSRDAVLHFAQPFLLDEVAREFPNLKIVIGNMGEPFLEQTLTMLAKHSNVYGDLTINPAKVWQVYNTVVAAYEREVMDKLLFGSGFPSGTAGECIETLLGFNKLLGDSSLPVVPRGHIRNVVERDALGCLGIRT